MISALDALNVAAHEGLQRLADGLLPGVLVTFAALLLCRWLGSAAARRRHAIWWVALIVVLVAPWLRGSADTGVVVQHAEVAVAQGTACSPIESIRAEAASPGAPIATVKREGSGDSGSLLLGLLPLALGAIWLMITSILLLRLLRSFRHARWMVRESRAFVPTANVEHACVVRRLALGSRVEVRISAAVDTPVAVGLGRPTILLPAALEKELSADELEAILLHERAHLSFGDPWTQLVQRLVEATFFFHPLVRWIGRRLDLERELACDGEVVRRTGSPGAYCRTLVRLKELASGHGHAFAPGVVTRRKQIFTRFEHILSGANEREAGASRFRLLAGSALATTSLALAVFAAPAIPLPFEPAVLTEPRNAPEDAEELGLGGERPVDWSHEVFRLPISATLLTPDGQEEMATLWVARDERLRTASFRHFEVDADASALVHLPEGGWFAVLDERDGERRELDVRPGAGGAPSYTFLVDGVTRELDEGARHWFAPILKQTIRGRGDYARDRVERLWKYGGRTAVLAELEHLENEYTRDRYLEELIPMGGAGRD